MRVSEFLGKWLLLKRARLAPTTYASYCDVVERFIIPFFGEMEIDKITPMDVELFLGGLLSASYSPQSVKRIYSIFGRL